VEEVGGGGGLINDDEKWRHIILVLLVWAVGVNSGFVRNISGGLGKVDLGPLRPAATSHFALFLPNVNHLAL
jgi:hypothetical protein